MRLNILSVITLLGLLNASTIIQTNTCEKFEKQLSKAYNPSLMKVNNSILVLSSLEPDFQDKDLNALKGAVICITLGKKSDYLSHQKSSTKSINRRNEIP